ncbi:hypothetical protein KKC06_06745 [Patescibacteria group bacterium]|uniref:Uncharacterized protein n=1 Tax=viral metagenome TaxID=1070528 RepID=A0A6M3LY79_9ZZZZ|nr:hypothetical protein [Patescibacteria group bacterium]
MAKRTGWGLPAVVVLSSAALLTGLVFYAVSKVAAAGSMLLYAGANTITYTGKDQYADEAFASIIDYLEIAYRLNPVTQEWEQVTEYTLMVYGEEYSIIVSEDCVWTF